MANIALCFTTCIIVTILKQYVAGYSTTKWYRFVKISHILDIDSQYTPFLETSSDVSLNECAMHVTADSSVVLWFVYNSDRRKCVTSLCWDIPTQEQSDAKNVLYRKQGVHAVKSCWNLKTASPGSKDGEHWLYPNALTFLGCPARIYCHNMTTDTPSEYLSLPVVNTGVYPNMSNLHCTGEKQELTGKGIGMSGTTHFNKIRIDVQTMTVKIKDFTFATANGTMHTYAVARDCYNVVSHPQCGPVGTFLINTEGTGIIISEQQTWRGFAHHPFPPNVTRSEDGRQIFLLCGGGCGGCEPSGPLQLHRDPRVPVVLT